MIAPTLGRRRASVRLRHTALIDMVLATIESAAVPPTLLKDSLNRLTAWDKSRRRKRVRDSPLPPSLIFSETGLETAGLLFGRSTKRRDQVRLSIERMFSVTSQRTDTSVGHSGLSAELMADWAWALNAPWRLLGGFHSHPLLGTPLDDIEEMALYKPSQSDLLGGPFFIGNSVGLIVAVAEAGEQLPRQCMRPSNVVHFRVGQFDLWISAYSKTFKIENLDVELPATLRDPADSPFRFENWFPDRLTLP
ncbi:hypothetical protein MUO32_21080 [Shinella sp. CPCC 101442]|uniref:hypothetical protein n=1 Tax=Shinella sp. CPCC 101442 TaxID=2932265 RepID=UPI002152BAC6|nr:hypothetical protein [Shinella sp. CPCC 101442]MCR6501535.1 hypothetical protein [Shinella sp. CPCC 101442]